MKKLFFVLFGISVTIQSLNSMQSARSKIPTLVRPAIPSVSPATKLPKSPQAIVLDTAKERQIRQSTYLKSLKPQPQARQGKTSYKSNFYQAGAETAIAAGRLAKNKLISLTTFYALSTYNEKLKAGNEQQKNLEHRISPLGLDVTILHLPEEYDPQNIKLDIEPEELRKLVTAALVLIKSYITGRLVLKGGNVFTGSRNLDRAQYLLKKLKNLNLDGVNDEYYKEYLKGEMNRIQQDLNERHLGEKTATEGEKYLTNNNSLT